MNFNIYILTRLFLPLYLAISFFEVQNSISQKSFKKLFFLLKQWLLQCKFFIQSNFIIIKEKKRVKFKIKIIFYQKAK